MWKYNYMPSSELYHHGILGMKWGVRRYQNKNGSLTSQGKKRYKSTGIRAVLAKRANDKVDKSFKDWDENTKKRANAIELGKKATVSKLAYESNRSDKALKSQYKQDNKAYKEALKGNTTYRKGQVRKEVGADLSRKYLSEAKKIQKQMNADPSNKQLQKRYNELMSKHDIERAKARRATDVAANRSAKKAAIKRGMTMGITSAAVTAAASAGAFAVNRYLSNHDVSINGQSVRIGAKNIKDIADAAKKIKDFMGFVY